MAGAGQLCDGFALHPELKEGASREGVRAGQERANATSREKSHPFSYGFAPAVELPPVTPHPPSMHVDWPDGNDPLSVPPSTPACEPINARIEVLLIYLSSHVMLDLDSLRFGIGGLVSFQPQTPESILLIPYQITDRRWRSNVMSNDNICRSCLNHTAIAVASELQTGNF